MTPTSASKEGVIPDRVQHLRIWSRITSPFLPQAALVLALAFTAPAHPQGCAQCRDQVSQTPERTQTAYRRGILLLVVSATSVFTAVLVTVRRYR